MQEKKFLRRYSFSTFHKVWRFLIETRKKAKLSARGNCRIISQFALIISRKNALILLVLNQINEKMHRNPQFFPISKTRSNQVMRLASFPMHDAIYREYKRMHLSQFLFTQARPQVVGHFVSLFKIF